MRRPGLWAACVFSLAIGAGCDSGERPNFGTKPGRTLIVMPSTKRGDWAFTNGKGAELGVRVAAGTRGTFIGIDGDPPLVRLRIREGEHADEVVEMWVNDLVKE